MPKSIDAAPRDGRPVQIQWRDRDGVENTSVARYISGKDPAQSGWWVNVDSDTMKRVEPHGWADVDAEEDE